MKRTPLKRTRGWPQGKSARRLGADDELRTVSREVMERARGVCEVCNAAQGNQAHHKLRRSQGGKNTKKNLLWVCSPCHQFIHEQPAYSYKQGWLLRRSGLQVDL